MPAPAGTDARAVLRDGITHHEAGRIAQARACYERVLAAVPGDPQALHLLGVLLRDSGDPGGGARLIERAIAAEPTQAVFHHNLGLAQRQVGRVQDAVHSFRRASALDPRAAMTWSCLGNALRALERLDEAIEAHNRAVVLAPKSPEVWSNAALALRQAGRTAEAVTAFERAIVLAPHAADLHHNLGNTLLTSDAVAPAVAAFRRALALNPAHVRARTDLGSALKEQGQLDASIAELRRAIEIDPESADAHFNLALTLLMKGDFRDGWGHYEWRRRIPEIPIQRFEPPAWDGARSDGTLLVHAEQGLGDCFQFVRFLPEARERFGGTVVFQCPAPLERVLRETGAIEPLVSRAEALPRFDVHAPLMSLPYLLGVGGELAWGAYLRAEPQRVEKLSARIGSEGLRVGIVWQGNPSYRADRRRSIPLAEFSPLAALPGVRLFSLQKAPGDEQLAAQPWPIENLAPELDRDGAFVDTAAALECLDLIVCSDTALAHLAGALGRPTWVALNSVPDWRWGLHGSESLWYPSLRLFRQHTAGDWKSVFADMTRALREKLA